MHSQKKQLALQKEADERMVVLYYLIEVGHAMRGAKAFLQTHGSPQEGDPWGNLCFQVTLATAP